MNFSKVPFYIRLLLPILWYGLIFYLTELPEASSDNTSHVVKEATAPVFEAITDTKIALGETNPIADAINAVSRIAAHLFVFGIQGILLYFLANKSFQFNKKLFWLIVFAVAILGISDEIHQSYVPGRNAAGIDVLKDIAGAIVFMLLAFKIVKHKTNQGFTSL